MKRVVTVLVVAVMVLLQGCGVSQEEYDNLNQKNNMLSEEVKRLESELETANNKKKQLEDEKLAQVEADMQLATPKAWATTHFGDNCIVLADNKEYLQIISKKEYALSNAGVKKIWKNILEASTTLTTYFDKINYDRIGIKFPQKDGKEMIEIVLKRKSTSYELESVSGDMFETTTLLPALRYISK